MKRSGLLVAICLFSGMLLCSDRCHPATRILKTAYKTYTVGTWQGVEILCEPYQVRNGDWLHKIFKKKGNLSEMNFPLFLTIFKHLNPHISNPDHIRPGQQISIPLKKTSPHDFASKSHGNVIVPILQMSEVSGKMDEFIPQHPVTAGIVPHEPTKGTLHIGDMERIQHFAAIAQGQLLNHGSYYFPGLGQRDPEVNLATTPMVLLENNAKIIILPHGLPQENVDLLRPLEGIWPNLSFMDMGMVERKVAETAPVTVLPGDRPPAVEMLLQKAGFDLLPFETTLRMAGGIEIAINAHRVPRHEKPDLLIFLGSIYGNALTLLAHQGYTVLSLLPGDQALEMSQKLFAALEISTLLNPVFMNQTTGQSTSLPGLFVGDGKNIFISSQPVSGAMQYFFAKNRTTLLQINGEHPPSNTHQHPIMKEVDAVHRDAPL